MAANPNTDFTAGQILTADQQNRFPRGIVAIGDLVGNTSFTTTEVVLVTASSFTAVANRYYKITYQIPAIIGQANEVEVGIRLTNASGTRFTKSSQLTNVSTSPTAFTTIVVTTLSAGATTIVGTGISYAGSVTLQASATAPCQLIVEDIGPA